VSSDAAPTPNPGPVEPEESRWAKWVLVVVAGQASLIVFVIVLGSVVKSGNPVAYVGAFALAVVIGGRVGGVRGPGQWVVAAVLIVAVAMLSLYLLIGAVVSQMTGP